MQDNITLLMHTPSEIMYMISLGVCISRVIRPHLEPSLLGSTRTKQNIEVVCAQTQVGIAVIAFQSMHLYLTQFVETSRSYTLTL